MNMADLTLTTTNQISSETSETPRTLESTTRRRLVGLMVAASLTALAPTVWAQSASADKGVGAWQYASNGKKFEELASLSTEEMGKLPEKIQTELEAWMDKKEQLKNQAAIEDAQRIEQKKQAAIASVSKKWAELSPMLSKMPQDKVIAYLKTDLEAHKRLLQYVVDNRLPPPGYAESLLVSLRSA